MSCIGTITNNTNVKIKNENDVPLIKDIKNHNMKWQIGKFEDLDNIQMIFDYFGIVIYHNDLEGYVEINNARGCFYEEESSITVDRNYGSRVIWRRNERSCR